MKSNEEVGQRRDQRYRAQAGTFAIIRGDPPILGVVIDISRGGLAFRYKANEDLTRGPLELDIVLTDYAFVLEKVPFKISSDSEIPSEAPFTSMKMRRCEVQFGELTQEQRSQVEYLIRNHTTVDM